MGGTPLGDEIDRLNDAIKTTFDGALREALGFMKRYLEINKGATLEDGIRFMEQVVEKESQ